MNTVCARMFFLVKIPLYIPQNNNIHQYIQDSQRVNIMSALIKKNLNYIQLILETKSKNQQKALLQTITRDQLKAVIEITYIVLHLNIPVGKKDRQNLVKHITLLKEVSNKKNSQKKILKLIRKKLAVILLVLKAALPSSLSLI